MSRLIDLTGKKFGRLTVIERHGDGFPVKWLCRCDCGGTAIVAGKQMKSGKTKSCGCIKREETINRNTSHGLSKHPLYKRWKDMRSRCQNKKNKFYNRYGGRGISVCEDWDNDFVSFYEWSVKNGYDESLQIDRIDNDGPYSPDNCRWVTCADNNHNTSQTKLDWEKVREMRKRFDNGESPYHVAKEYGIFFSTAYKIRAKEAWKE